MSLHTPSPVPSPRPDTEWDINDISDASVPKVRHAYSVCYYDSYPCLCIVVLYGSASTGILSVEVRKRLITYCTADFETRFLTCIVISLMLNAGKLGWEREPPPHFRFPGSCTA